MQPYQQIDYQVQQGVAIIRLNRPEQGNAYTQQMGDEWNHAYQQADTDDLVRVIVVTGAGRSFCVGADMSGGADTFDSQEDMSFSSCPITPAWRLRKPVIGALNGHAVGLGFGLALQFDFRIVAAEAKYGLLQARRGVLADACSHWLLPRLIGPEKALQVILMGQTMRGVEVYEKGLALTCVSADEVLNRALAMAEELAQQSAPAVVAMAKRLVWQSYEHSVQEFESLETEFLHHSMGQPDALEGGMAFVERRQPQWQGSVNDTWQTLGLAADDEETS